MVGCERQIDGYDFKIEFSPILGKLIDFWAFLSESNGGRLYANFGEK